MRNFQIVCNSRKGQSLQCCKICGAKRGSLAEKEERLHGFSQGTTEATGTQDKKARAAFLANIDHFIISTASTVWECFIYLYSCSHLSCWASGVVNQCSKILLLNSIYGMRYVCSRFPSGTMSLLGLLHFIGNEFTNTTHSFTCCIPMSIPINVPLLPSPALSGENITSSNPCVAYLIILSTAITIIQ